MFLLGEPSREAIEDFIALQKDLPFSYREVEANRMGVSPKGYTADRYRGRLGEEDEAYRRVTDALRDWRRFDLGWPSLHPPGTKIEAGSVVAMLIRRLGFRLRW